MGKVKIDKNAIRKLEKDIEKRISNVSVDASKSSERQARDLKRQMERQGFEMKLSEAKKAVKGAK